jgi:hypothetical protein
MSEKTKKQHYVWEFYLKGWSTNNQIFCKRDGQIFKTSTENVAQERYFYEKESLSPEEIRLVEKLIADGPAINQAVDRSSLLAYVSVANSQGDTVRYGIEWYHSTLEGKADRVLREIRKGNIDILDDRQSKIDFCLYLGHQYMRTKKIRDSYEMSSLSTKQHPNCNLRKIYDVMAFIRANTVGSYLYSHLNLQLKSNESGKNLITSDQPIYNISAIPGEAPNEFTAYFPVSPKLALWAMKAPNDERIDTPDKAERLNAFMAANSHEFVFAEREEDLLDLRTTLLRGNTP